MISPLKWKCVVLDDQLPEIRRIAAALDSMGVECVAGPSDGEERVHRIGIELAEQLRDAHIVFIDMKWGSEGRGGSEAALKGLTRGRIDSLKVFREWTASYSSARDFDGANRGDDLVGYILGAGISQLNPHAQLVFFTSAGERSWHLSVKALQHFRPAPYRVVEKDVESAQAEACAAIISLLKGLLSYSPEFHRWLVGQVILPLLVGGRPSAGRCYDLWSEREGRTAPEEGWIVEPEEVLPPYVTDGQWNLPLLIELLPKLPWRVPLADRWAIRALQHDLRRFCDNPEAIKRKASRLRAKCASAGPRGLRLLGPLQDVICSPSTDGIKKLLQDTERNSRNDLRSLEEFCWKNQGLFEVDSMLRTPVQFLPPDKRDPLEDLPFDLFHLELAVDALRHNLERLLEANAEDRATAFAVQAHRATDGLSVTYLDNSPGFANKTSLAAELNKSLGKSNALERGLPLALSFPFYYPFKELAFLTQDGNWITLADDGRATAARPTDRIEPSDAGTRFRFGVCWTFRLESWEGAARQ